MPFLWLKHIYTWLINSNIANIIIAFDTTCIHLQINDMSLNWMYCKLFESFECVFGFTSNCISYTDGSAGVSAREKSCFFFDSINMVCGMQNAGAWQLHFNVYAVIKRGAMQIFYNKNNNEVNAFFPTWFMFGLHLYMCYLSSYCIRTTIIVIVSSMSHCERESSYRNPV